MKVYYKTNNGILYQGNVLEVLKSLPDESVDTIITSPPYWCYASGHEILTDKGWKDISVIKVGDKVLSVNPQNLELEWARVTKTNKWEYNGEMIEFKNTYIDLLVTPNHKMFVYYKKIGNGIKPREEVGYFKNTNRYNNHFFIDAKDIKEGYVTPKTGFKWKGKDEKYFILPELQTIYNKQRKYYPPLRIKMEDWVSFFGIWIAEGSVRGSKGGRKINYSVSIKQKENKANKIRKLLKRLPFKFNEYINNTSKIVTFEISNKQLWMYLKKFGNSYSKYIPKEIKELSPRLLNIFMKWYLLGDGNIKKKNKSYQINCFTVSNRLMGDIQEISLKIGSNISIQKDSNLTFLRRRTVKLKNVMKSMKYKGKIYGVEVEKNHTLCVRRNGKIIFSGNSLRDYGEDTNIIWGGDPDCDHEWGISEKSLNMSVPDKSTLLGYTNDKVKIRNMDNIIKNGFCKKCGAWYGQLGLEPTLNMYIEHLFQITLELKRVLKETGILFWNHDDCYGGSGAGSWKNPPEKINSKEIYHLPYGSNPRRRSGDFSVKQKCLTLQNYRLILRMVDEQGWILRGIIIWYKPNHMPSSVKDRFANAYEPVFMLVKNRAYYFDLDSVRIPHKQISIERAKRAVSPNHKYADKPYYGGGRGINKPRPNRNKYQVGIGSVQHKEDRDEIVDPLHPLGKNPGDLWAIPTQPFPEAHFATYPEKLIEPMIKAGCPQWICKKCGKARERVVESNFVKIADAKPPKIGDGKRNPTERTDLPKNRGYTEHYTINWTDCSCNAGWEAGIVLDPFMGSGTTAVVAEKLGRRWIGIELNEKYCEIAKKRIEKIVKGNLF